jgi:hypothetical protein
MKTNIMNSEVTKADEKTAFHREGEEKTCT